MRTSRGVVGAAPKAAQIQRLREVCEWYFERIYGRIEGAGITPFYCDPERVGHFAVRPAALAVGEHSAVFRLLVGLSMYQARRDRLLMDQQSSMLAEAVRSMVSPAALRRTIAETHCLHLDAAADFERGCTVYKRDGVVDCATRPHLPCPVKEATTHLRRMGDMGKTPVSALRAFGARGAFDSMLVEVSGNHDEPRARAEAVVARVQAVWRVGEKLATLFVSALSTPALAAGLTPWHPALDGNHLVVVDTNVAALVDGLRPDGARTYAARAQWIREAARAIDLRQYSRKVPAYSPRLVQQAMYWFASKSNRQTVGLGCQRAGRMCPTCAPAPCLTG